MKGNIKKMLRPLCLPTFEILMRTALKRKQKIIKKNKNK